MSNPTIFSFSSFSQPTNSSDQSNLLNQLSLSAFRAVTGGELRSTEAMNADKAIPFVFFQVVGEHGRPQVLVIFDSYNSMEKYQSGLPALFSGAHLQCVGYLKAYDFLKNQSFDFTSTTTVPFYVRGVKDAVLYPVKPFSNHLEVVFN